MNVKFSVYLLRSWGYSSFLIFSTRGLYPCPTKSRLLENRACILLVNGNKINKYYSVGKCTSGGVRSVCEYLILNPAPLSCLYNLETLDQMHSMCTSERQSLAVVRQKMAQS